MKHLKEIKKTDYDLDRDACADPEGFEDDVDSLFIARFWAREEKIAVEGLISARKVSEDVIGFQQVTDDGELIGTAYEANIDENGIIGALVLRDGSVLRTQEGYLLNFGNSIDDEFADIIALHEKELVPVHVTLGGAAGDATRRELSQTPDASQL